MPDIKAIAATYAARIFDRMELCRGSAILKSDIEREVEMALHELFDQMWPKFDDDTEHDEHLGPVLKRVYPHITPEGTIYVGDEAAKTAIIGKPYSVLQAEKDFHEAYVDPPQIPPLPSGLPTLAEMQEFWADLALLSKPHDAESEDASS